MQKLNSTQQKWLALGLLVGVILVVSLIIFLPWYQAINEKLEAIDDQVFKIQRYQRVIASKDEVLEKVEQRRQEIYALDYFYAKDSYSLAEAELQNQIKTIAESVGGDISSTQILPLKEQEEIVRIAVKIRLQGSMEMFRNLLYEIETGTPFLFIDDLSIIPQRGRRNRRTRQIEETGNITVTIEVSSYMRKISEAD